MTREEAIELLCAYGVPQDEKRFQEAIDMAIKALSVVRCKECKHRSDGGWCDVYIQPRMETDFCNHGERQCNYFGERKEP